MLHIEREILWRFSATCFGMAMPSMLFGRTLLFAFIILGAISGLLATKGHSLRASINLLLQSKLIWILGALMTSFAISSATSLTPEASWDKFGQLGIVAIVAFSVFLTLREMTGKHLEVLFKSLAISTAVCSVIALTDALSGYDRLGIFIHGDWFDTPYRLNFYTGALAVILPFLWARMITKRNEQEPFAKIVFIPFMALTFIAMIVAGGRIGWAGALVAVTAFVFIATRRHNLTFNVKQGAATLLVALIGLGGYVASHGIAFFLERMDLNSSPRGFGGGRGEIWSIAWENSFQNPIFGIGVNGFRHLPETSDLHPHSAPLQLLLETGFVGLALSLILVLYILKTFWGYAQNSLYGTAALSSFLAFLTVSLANTSIFNIWWLAFFVMITLIGWRAGWSTQRG